MRKLLDRQIAFVTGMFRSGTTLLARMLDVHPQIASASDPLRPMFNCFQQTLGNVRTEETTDWFAPLSDYFMDDSGALQRVLNADLNVPLPIDTKEIEAVVRQRAAMFSGWWADTVEFHSPQTFADFLVQGLSQVLEVYGRHKNDVRTVAFKEVWCTEFTSALLRSLPNAKAILMVRDPRDVAASNAATGRRYPLFFLSRQWRKLAFLTQFMKTEWRGRVTVLRYEDLVADPVNEIKSLTKFIGVDFNEDLLDLSWYRNGRGEPWKQNSNYENQGLPNRINTKSVGKWKKILQERETRLIEFICRDCMEYYGYAPSWGADDLLDSSVNDFKRLEEEEMADWIKPYSFDNDKRVFEIELLKEKLRLLASISGHRFTEEEAFFLQMGMNLV